MGQFELFKGKGKHPWRWRFKADNGEIIADSAEGYVNKEDAGHGITVLKNEAQTAYVIET
jgi:hypothetical protein